MGDAGKRKGSGEVSTLQHVKTLSTVISISRANSTRAVYANSLKHVPNAVIQTAKNNHSHLDWLSRGRSLIEADHVEPDSTSMEDRQPKGRDDSVVPEAILSVFPNSE